MAAKQLSATYSVLFPQGIGEQLSLGESEVADDGTSALLQDLESATAPADFARLRRAALQTCYAALDEKPMTVPKLLLEVRCVRAFVCVHARARGLHRTRSCGGA